MILKKNHIPLVSVVQKSISPKWPNSQFSPLFKKKNTKGTIFNVNIITHKIEIKWDTTLVNILSDTLSYLHIFFQL